MRSPMCTQGACSHRGASDDVPVGARRWWHRGAAFRWVAQHVLLAVTLLRDEIVAESSVRLVCDGMLLYIPQSTGAILRAPLCHVEDRDLGKVRMSGWGFLHIPP